MKTKEEVLSILKTHPNGNIEEPQFKKKFPEHYQILSAWEFPSDFKFTQKLFHYFNDDSDLKLGLCPVCGNRCKFTKFNKGYHIYCSKKCSYKSKDRLTKCKNTCLEKYGVEFYSKTNDYKEKTIKTCLEKYGVKNVFQSEEKKQKIKNTLKEKYGAEHALQIDEFKQKAKETTIKKYGVENYSSLQECRYKVKQTNLEKYGEENFTKTTQYKESVHRTSLEKYGVNHFTQTKEYKEHLRNVMKEKYGVEHALQVDKFKQKAKETCKERYGVEYASQSEIIKDKMKQTTIERYGVENYSQTTEWSHKKQKRIIYKDISFDSSWELEVFKYCEENNINCIYQPNITFDYEFDGMIHKYHPDFLINNKLYEVKGNQFFDGDKMICPYDRDEYKDGLAEAKHQCMIKNNVTILRGEDIKKLKEIF